MKMIMVSLHDLENTNVDPIIAKLANYKEQVASAKKPYKKKTCDVGRIVPYPDGKRIGVMVNGKPQGEVKIKKANGKRTIIIKIFDKTIKFNPTGKDGRMTQNDDVMLRLKISDAFFEYQDKLYPENK